MLRQALVDSDYDQALYLIVINMDNQDSPDKPCNLSKDHRAILTESSRWRAMVKRACLFDLQAPLAEKIIDPEYWHSVYEAI